MLGFRFLAISWRSNLTGTRCAAKSFSIVVFIVLGIMVSVSFDNIQIAFSTLPPPPAPPTKGGELVDGH